MGFDLAALNPFASVATVVLNRILPDKEKQAEAQNELGKMALSGELAQIAGQLKINEVEAANANWFVAGARPGVMWVCVLGLFMQVIIRPLMLWISALHGDKPVDLPAIDITTLITLLAPLLGLSVARTVEKLNNAQDNH